MWRDEGHDFVVLYMQFTCLDINIQVNIHTSTASLSHEKTHPHLQTHSKVLNFTDLQFTKLQ